MADFYILEHREISDVLVRCIHYSLFITHYLLPIIYYPLFITHYLLPIIHYPLSLPIIHGAEGDCCAPAMP